MSSTRWDPFLLHLRWNNHSVTRTPSPFFLLPFHVDRLRDAAAQHNWDSALDVLSLDSVTRVCLEAVNTARSFSDPPRSLKVRILLSEEGQLSAIASPLDRLYSDPLSASFSKPSDNPSLFAPVRGVVIDSEPTPTSLFTQTKTTERTVYNDARARAGMSLTDYSADVLLYNEDGCVTETSIYNVAVWRPRGAGGHWITPAASTGCLPGVIRRWLLEQGRIREAKDGSEITLDGVNVGESVLLFNGVQGCRLGRITASHRPDA